jgi:hypothetical protein
MTQANVPVMQIVDQDDPNAPEVVGNTSVSETLEVAEAVNQLFRLAKHRFGLGAALSGLATSYVNMAVWNLGIDELRASLQTAIDGLPNMYEKREQVSAQFAAEMESRKDLN